MKIGFIGAGVTATALARALSGSGYNVVAVAGRSRASAARLSTAVPGSSACARPQEVADASDLVFITTPDDTIASVAASVEWKSSHGVVHCSGALSVDALARPREASALVGSFHPLLSFAGGAQDAESFPGCTIAIEAEGKLLGVLEELAAALGATALRLKPEDKVIYHAAAVFAGNYIVALLGVATDLWRLLGLAPSEAARRMAPLVQSTLRNLRDIGYPGSLTGPIARGDRGTVARHLRALAERAPDTVEVYRVLAEKSIQAAAAKGTIDAETAGELRKVLRGHGSSNE